MKKARILLTALFLCIFLLNACSSASGEKKGATTGTQPLSERHGGIIKPVLTSDPATLDPIFGKAVNEQIPGAHIFDTALTADPGGEVFPGVCTYEVKEGGRIIELKVRDKIKFHNGDVCDAGDIEASTVRWMANVPFAKTNVGDMLESMKIVNNALVFTFKKPSPLALTAISAWDHGLYVMPKEICEKYPNKQLDREGYIGSGPYTFKEHQADRYVLVERFKDYIPGDSKGTGFAAPRIAYADQIQFNVSSDKAATINGVQTGAYDVCVSVPANMIPTLSANQNLKVEPREMGIMPTMHFNCKKGPATDINLRNAILSCLNMDDLMMAAQGDRSLYYLNPSVMVKSSRWFTDESLGKYNNVNLEKAKEYLKKSSYKGEALVFLTTKDNDYFYKTAMLVADMVKPIGIKIDVQVSDNATLKQYRDNPDKFDIFSGGLTSKPDPTLISYLDSAWAGFYTSARKDELIKVFSTEMDFKKRYDAWVELTKVLYEDLPVITFGERTNAIVYNKKLQDMWTTSQQYYWNTWIAK